MEYPGRNVDKDGAVPRRGQYLVPQGSVWKSANSCDADSGREKADRLNAVSLAAASSRASF